MVDIQRDGHFRRGLDSFDRGEWGMALASFESALRAERGAGALNPDLRLLSFYGLALLRAGHSSREAVRACEAATRRGGADPILTLNLARVYAETGRRSLALSVLERGRREFPSHGGIAGELARLDRRSAPSIRFLSRNHPANVALGKLRASIAGRSRRAVTS